MKALLLAALVLAGQEIHLDGGGRRPLRQHVELVEDRFTVPAGRAEEIELRFRVGANLHINSHAPKDELLLPTTLKLEGRVEKIEYPVGHPFRLAIGEGQTLDVYQGEFRVKVRLTAPGGESKWDGALRYQACDTASCLPPQTLPVHLVVLGQ